MSKLIREKKIKISTICLYIIVLLSFTHHFFVYSLPLILLALLFAFFVFVGVIFKGIIRFPLRSVSLTWIPAMAAMLYSYLFVSSGDPASRVDILILLIGMLFCMFFFADSKDFSGGLRISFFMGAFYSFGVIIQQFIPPLYRLMLIVFPPRMRAAITASGGNNGFTINSGFAAGFIIVGILALIALYLNDRRKSSLRIFLLIFLAVALLFTGKRAHPLFLGMTLLMCYLLPARGSKRMKRYWIIFLIFFTMIILFFAFKDLLANIPFMASIIESLEGLKAGEDITSARSDLSAYAWKLFFENPVFGVGWGDYKTAVIGKVTAETELDVHNIYLQLLAETGIIGFVCFMIPMTAFWLSAKKAYCNCMNNKNVIPDSWKAVTFFAFAFQTFFLIYGLTGNPLYDTNWQIMYMISCSMVLSYFKYERKKMLRVGEYSI